MIGFGCGTIWLKDKVKVKDQIPILRLKGEKLMKQELTYAHQTEDVPCLSKGMKLGEIREEIIGNCDGDTELGRSIHHRLKPLGSSTTRPSIYKRPRRVLGDPYGLINFGQNELNEFGLTRKEILPPYGVFKLPYSGVRPLPQDKGETLWSQLFHKTLKVVKELMSEL